MDIRIYDFIAEITVRSDDSQEIKSELDSSRESSERVRRVRRIERWQARSTGRPRTGRSAWRRKGG
jgi:hypothetical protein